MIQLRTTEDCPRCGHHVYYRLSGGPWRILTAARTECVLEAKENEK
ncbi:hypothetical protein [Kineococcus sp. R86509]